MLCGRCPQSRMLGGVETLPYEGSELVKPRSECETQVEVSIAIRLDHSLISGRSSHSHLA